MTDRKKLKEILLKAMDDMLMDPNIICHYIIQCDGKEIWVKKKEISVFMMTHDWAIRFGGGNAECYMAPDYVKAAKPLFRVENGRIYLNDQEIKYLEDTEVSA